MTIKFLDLAAQDQEIEARLTPELASIREKTAYVGGASIAAFEKEFADYLGVRHVVGVSSGTDALRLTMLAMGIGPGDEVVTVPMTFIATVAAIVQTGARPAFVDIDPDTCNMSIPALLQFLDEARRSGRRIRAILPVHLYGLPAHMVELREIATKYGIKLIEDACQAHGAKINIEGRWVRAGALGDAACFSFYPGKNLGAWGDAGAIATNDDALARTVANLGDHGRISHYAHSAFGYNSRMDTVQAAVLRAKLERLDEWNEKRRRVAAHYRELLGRSGLRLPLEPEGFESSYHLFVVRTPKRDALRTAMLADQIQCGIHYPVPVHLQPACRDQGYRAGDFPVSESVADSVLSLPMHPHLRPQEVHRVATVVKGALAEL
ncbi:MAG: DegT/DnrJ/EryC1/StrS family aminotransferase [Candidatus Binatus sp.]|uniref:DegT/DnrJ/EryC1/StrS family aminotransferase n=1 Tax=Candidatus Binatus sp. TaxID=2811406 RepID=UPI00271CDFDC|nr:DegT/DnrJ/EryC1/StrS family aminotransferase [Candidatus Binatus sp.]MDO8432690.1 DegT/DnrJ/EryC1/StrS family aminotransferase [Candidatus Binatus sp.]